MSHWVRLWEDMPNDPKWRVVAKRAGRPISEVLSIFVHMMTVAGAARDRGSIEGWNDEDIATALDMEPAHVRAIREAMQGKTLEGDRLTGWERRQPKREDGAADRSRAWRERKTADKRTQPNATERERAPEEKRIETEKKETDARKRVLLANLNSSFERFWQAWPNKVGKPHALRAFASVAPELDAILPGLQRYIRDKPPDRAWLNPSTFLNQRRWEDAPAPLRGNGPSAAPAEPHVFVLVGSPAWGACRDRWEREIGNGAKMRGYTSAGSFGERGCHFPKAWPETVAAADPSSIDPVRDVRKSELAALMRDAAQSMKV